MASPKGSWSKPLSYIITIALLLAAYWLFQKGVGIR